MPIFEARLHPACAFRKVVEAMKVNTLGEVMDKRDRDAHATLRCTERGIVLEAMDLCGTSCFGASLPAQHFAKYHCAKDLDVDVNVACLATILRLAQDDDTIELLIEDTSMLNISVSDPERSRTSDCTIKIKVSEHCYGIVSGALDADSYTVDVEIPASKFARVLKSMEGLDESEIRMSVNKGGLHFGVSDKMQFSHLCNTAMTRKPFRPKFAKAIEELGNRGDNVRLSVQKNWISYTAGEMFCGEARHPFRVKLARIVGEMASVGDDVSICVKKKAAPRTARPWWARRERVDEAGPMHRVTSIDLHLKVAPNEASPGEPGAKRQRVEEGMVKVVCRDVISDGTTRAGEVSQLFSLPQISSIVGRSCTDGVMRVRMAAGHTIRVDVDVVGRDTPFGTVSYYLVPKYDTEAEENSGV